MRPLPLFHPPNLDIVSKNRLNVTKSEREWKMVKVSAILLGAGESKRMGVNKLSLLWGRTTVLSAASTRFSDRTSTRSSLFLAPRPRT